MKRRTFLKIVPCLAAWTALSGCDSDSPTLKDRKLTIGDIKGFTEPVTLLEMQRIAIVKDFEGLSAISLLCTHQVCLLRMSPPSLPAKLICPCHGSEFALNGEVLTGPALRPLPHYELTVDANGELTVDLSAQVSDKWRLRI